MTVGNDGTYDTLKQTALSMGACLFGVADLDVIRADTDLLDGRYNSYSRGISVGVKLDDSVLAGIVDGPTPEYCREYKKANTLLDSVTEALMNELGAMGANALCIPASEVVDWENLRGHLSHKLIGHYAGLGWIGRGTLLINPNFGARVRYVTVLTDAELRPDSPINNDCGECSLCGAVCPAHAIADDPSRFDVWACFDKLGEFNELLGEPHFICGICVKVCRGDNSRG